MPYNVQQLRSLRATIGQNIQRQRVKQKMPLRRLSRLSGVSERLLDHYELGKNEIRLEELAMIASVLGIKTSALLD